uniref:Secreted protein n=1 Tax=Haemonchus contortus TaxID=6289 RepID=A0A7I5EBT8_HAECO
MVLLESLSILSCLMCTSGNAEHNRLGILDCQLNNFILFQQCVSQPLILMGEHLFSEWFILYLSTR